MFQDPATAVAEGVIDLHNDIMTFLVPITILVVYFLLRICILFNDSKSHEVIHVNHHTALEIFWTVAPAIILFTIAVPRFALLYAIEEIKDVEITIKCIGNQWY